MPTRAGKFVSTVFAGVLASIPITTTSHGQAAPADNCLTAPKGETPPGSHWRYHIERGTNRHCWYLRGEGESQSLAAPQSILPPAKPRAPQPDMASQRPVADAHAELPAQMSRNDGPIVGFPPVAGPSGSARAAASDANAASIAPASPDPLPATPPASSPPTMSSQASNSPPNPIPTLATADAALIPDAADAPSRSERGLMPMLVAIFGACTLMSGLIARFIRLRQQQPRKFRARRGAAVCDLTDDDRIVLSEDPGVYDLARQPAFSRPVRNVREPSNRRSSSSSRPTRHVRT